MVEGAQIPFFVPAFELPTVRVQFSDGTFWPHEMSPAGGEAFVERWNSLRNAEEPSASLFRDAHT